MGATIWYYPHGGQPLKAVDLSAPLSEIAVREIRDEVVHEAISGRKAKVRFSTRFIVRVTAELITSQTTIHELEVIANHLRRGGTVAVGENNNQSLGAFLRVAPEAGDTTLQFHPQLYGSFGGEWTPTTGEVLLLRGPSPKGLREDVVCAGGGSSSGATLSTACRHDWGDEDWIFVHNRSFWPALVLQRGRTNEDILRSTRRIHYTLDLPLEESPHALARLAEAPDEPLLGGEIEEGLGTLDERAGGERPPTGFGFEESPGTVSPTIRWF